MSSLYTVTDLLAPFIDLACFQLDVFVPAEHCSHTQTQKNNRFVGAVCATQKNAAAQRLSLTANVA